MAYRYCVRKKKFKKDDEQQELFYACARSTRVVGVDEFAKEISDGSSLTEGDVLAALKDFKKNSSLLHIQLHIL